ncbi:uncharacterized protein LOC114352923 [Ostrinia furnacalis]|uniref:uncharacterized protein LOC114352923 n=1 Tax=Ostrinia furnacalis TaxID=93504 RepID=UPI00103BF6DF|nr:uncharacterized protein LOC114352923 [Ostrinia furnacalis]
MATEAPKENRPPKPGRLVIQYLQEKKDGASAKEILRYLRSTLGNDELDLERIVEAVLVNGSALGFLERKGSHYMNWSRKTCGRRRRRRVGRRRSCGRRRRKRRRC